MRNEVKLVWPWDSHLTNALRNTDLANHLCSAELGLLSPQWVGPLNLQPGLHSICWICIGNEMIGLLLAMLLPQSKQACAHVNTREDMVAQAPAASPCHNGCG